MTQAAGYVIHDDTALWGTGATEAAAWANFDANMAAAHVTVVDGGAPDQDGTGGSFADRGSFSAMPATAALIADVDARGGAIGWSIVDGVACTVDEAEAAA